MSGTPVQAAEGISTNYSARQVVEVPVKGVLVSSVRLDVSGAGATVLTNTSAPTNSPASIGTLDFGTFSSQTPETTSNTTFAGRARVGTPGVIMAGSFTARLTFSGADRGTLNVSRKVSAGALPDIPANNLRMASPALETWTQASDGINIPNPGSSVAVCTGAFGACTSGTAYLHQIAVFVPDTQAAGAFSSVVVYTATAL